MTKELVTYIVFGAVMVLALVFDLGLLSKKDQKITIRQAMFQTMFWVALALGFFVFMWIENGQSLALEYLSAYLMEWSLSIDNIFVFILIFSSFGVKEQYFGRALLIGILMAVIFRVLFITVGVALVNQFEWVLYIFGAFLVYTGFKFLKGQEEETNIEDMKLLKWLRGHLPITPQLQGNKFLVRNAGKLWVTPLFIVLILVEFSDVIFAVDSIPAIFAVTSDPFIVLSANLMAILGLRAMFFLLAGAAVKMHYLPYGLGIILLFIGFKMLMLDFFHLPIWLSLGFIALVLSITAFLSLCHPPGRQN